MLQSIVPGNGNAVKVLGKGPKDIEHALRLWKKNVKESNVIENLKSKMEYEKPTTKKRRLKNDAIRNRKRNERL